MRSKLMTMVMVSVGCSTALEASTTFNVVMDGAQEVGVGDPTGFGSGTITFDPVTDMISWNITYANLTDDPIYEDVQLSGFHVHGPGGSAGSNAGVLINLDNLAATTPSGVDSVPNGTLTSGGALPFTGSLIDQVLADPTDFYLNLHTDGDFGGGFPLGAIRGQLPEPASMSLMAIGGLALLRRRRRTR